jgi:hypothetical protein
MSAPFNAGDVNGPLTHRDRTSSTSASTITVDRGLDDGGVQGMAPLRCAPRSSPDGPITTHSMFIVDSQSRNAASFEQIVAPHPSETTARTHDPAAALQMSPCWRSDMTPLATDNPFRILSSTGTASIQKSTIRPWPNTSRLPLAKRISDCIQEIIVPHWCPPFTLADAA